MLRVATGAWPWPAWHTAHLPNVGETSGRLLVITTPSGLKRFFEQFGELVPGPVDPETIAALGRPLGRAMGPPLAVSDPLRASEVPPHSCAWRHPGDQNPTRGMRLEIQETSPAPLPAGGAVSRFNGL
jgi:hypothetical protein